MHSLDCFALAAALSRDDAAVLGRALGWLLVPAGIVAWQRWRQRRKGEERVRASLLEEDRAALARMDPSLLEAYAADLARMDERQWEAHRETLARIQEGDRIAKPLAAQLFEGAIIPWELRERLPGPAWDQLRKALFYRGMRLEPAEPADRWTEHRVVKRQCGPTN